jgi:Uma2 family endonuclease
MPQVTRRPLTVHDYMLMPEGGPRYQLIDGEIHMAPAPSRFHQHISGNIEFILRKYLEQNPIGVVYHAPFDVVLTDINVFQPDILFVSKAHEAVLTEHGAEGAPDFVVEILSKKTAHLDKGAKREVYARTGVTELWIINPETRRVGVYCLQKDMETPSATYDDASRFESPLFPGLMFETNEFFKM